MTDALEHIQKIADKIRPVVSLLAYRADISPKLEPGDFEKFWDATFSSVSRWEMFMKVLVIPNSDAIYNYETVLPNEEGLYKFQVDIPMIQLPLVDKETFMVLNKAMKFYLNLYNLVQRSRK